MGIGSALIGLGAGILWVAQGSLLTACCSETDRGRWSGIFWASFMGGNAAGNFATAALESTDAVSNSALFLVLAAVAACSSFCFAVLTQKHGFMSSGRLWSSFSLDSCKSTDKAELLTEMGQNVKRGDEDESLGKDVHELLVVFAKPQLLVLAPLLLFIGSEQAFWSGAFTGIIGDAWGSTDVALASGVLAVADILASIVTGVALDFCQLRHPRWGPRIVLVIVIAVFCCGLALVVARVRPVAALVTSSNHSDHSMGKRDGHTAPAVVFAAAVLMGLGDGGVNTAITARLGRLAEDVGMLPRRTAFQYFQCVNVLMTGVSFAYMRCWPLEHSLMQAKILLVLVIISATCFTLFAQPLAVS